MSAKRELSRSAGEHPGHEFISSLVDSRPRIIWIELTSKCPFDCVFCSRKQERGAGEHMDFGLYASLIEQLERPEIVRLNYSGESMHYPRLLDAIRMARATGATTELVSALGSAPRSAVEALVDAGLHRLSVSIHSMDAEQFPRLYGHGSLQDICERIDYLQRYRSEHGSQYPDIDFAFVAMHENLSQLPAVVEYARRMGVRQVSIHAVIRRGAIAIAPFVRELDEAGKLRNEFAARIRQEVDGVRRTHPDVAVTIARPDPAAETADSGITTCEQNPWNTVHVLADGNVVVCEVQDRVSMGNLHRQTLAEIWNGTLYRDVRWKYVNGAHPACVECPWRRTVPTQAGRQIPVRGWHPSQGDDVQWSEANAALAVVVPPGINSIRVAGMLPPPADGSDGNALSIRCSSKSSIKVLNRASELTSFEAHVPTEVRGNSSVAVLEFETKERFCPVERGQGPDLRRLGFALTGLSFSFDRARRDKVTRVLRMLEHLERVSMLRKIPAAPRALPQRSGVSVLIPARDMPDLLGPTLQAAEIARERIDEPSEVIVVVSGSDGAACAGLFRRFPRVNWLFEPKPLAYAQAVERGLRIAPRSWVYLLNSDMALEPDALTKVMELRRSNIFAIGSRIRMKNGTGDETNWTDLSYAEDGAVELVERNPAGLREPRGCLYVGGGSGLFRASLLEKFIRRTRAYAPFYWEDVEWGARAWRLGYHCVFCPDSEAVHGHRRTISRYYDAAEISRVFERNRLLFHLRNLRGLRCLEKRLLSLDERSWGELFAPAALLDTARARAGSFMASGQEHAFLDRWKISY